MDKECNQTRHPWQAAKTGAGGLLHPPQIFDPATVKVLVRLKTEPAIVDPVTRARGAAALTIEDQDRSPFADDRAGAVDSVADKHTRFEGAGRVMREKRALVALGLLSLRPPGA
jgi:hypothetical protein